MLPRRGMGLARVEPEAGARRWFSRLRGQVGGHDASTPVAEGLPGGSFPWLLVPADREAKPVRCNPNEDTDGKFIPAEHIVQFVDKAYTLRGAFRATTGRRSSSTA